MPHELDRVVADPTHLIRRKVFEEVGGFNPELETDEDMEFMARCRRFERKLSVEQRFEAVHLKRFSFRSLMADHLRKTFDAVTARRRYPGVYRDFGLCRNQLRERAHKGELPGVVKSSW